MKAASFSILLLLTVAACGRESGSATSTSDAAVIASSSASSSAAGAPTRAVDMLELHTLCLLGAIATPPNTRSNIWRMAGVLSAGGAKYGWIHVDQTAGDVPEGEAFAYVSTIPVLLGGNRTMNSNGAICDLDWEVARAHTIITAVVKIAGPGGKYAIYGGLGTGDLGTNDHGTAKIISNGSPSDAREQAMKLAGAAIGQPLRLVRAENADWATGVVAP